MGPFGATWNEQIILRSDKSLQTLSTEHLCLGFEQLQDLLNWIYLQFHQLVSAFKCMKSSGLPWAVLGLRCPSVPAGTDQIPTPSESGCCPLSKPSLGCYLLSRAGTEWPCQTCSSLCPNRLFSKHVCSLLCVKNLPVHIPFNMEQAQGTWWLQIKPLAGNCRNRKVEGKVSTEQSGAVTAMWFHTCTAPGRLSGRSLIHSKAEKRPHWEGRKGHSIAHPEWIIACFWKCVFNNSNPQQLWLRPKTKPYFP